MLAKSLHTVTAAANVARYAMHRPEACPNGDAVYWAHYALAVLGYRDVSLADPTVAKIIKACAALLVQS